MSENKKKFSLKDLKGANQSAVKEQSKEIENAGGGKKQEFITIIEGTNKLRIFPAHPGTDENDLYAQKRTVSWVPFKKDDGTESRRPILNARVHGGQDKDIIECYIKKATEAIKNNRKMGAKEKSKALDALVDFSKGLAPKGSYQMYAKNEVKKDGKTEVFRGIFEATYGIKRKMDALATSELEDDPEAVDPISDPIDGSVLKLTYDKKKDNNNKYAVVLDRGKSPLTEEDVEWLNEQKPLTELLLNVYHKGHFDRAMEGLEIYDEKNKIGVFEDDDFQDLAAELKALLPDAPERGDSDDDDDEDEEVAFDDMTRDELKQFIMDNNLDIKITRKMEADDLLDAIAEALDLDELPEFPSDLKKKKDKKAKPEPAKEEKKSSKKSSRKDEEEEEEEDEPVDFDDEDEEEEEEKPKKSSKKTPAKEEKSSKRPTRKPVDEDEDDEEEEEEEEKPTRTRRSERRSRG